MSVDQPSRETMQAHLVYFVGSMNERYIELHSTNLCRPLIQVIDDVNRLIHRLTETSLQLRSWNFPIAWMPTMKKRYDINPTTSEKLA
jgi:hypothetical protein